MILSIFVICLVHFGAAANVLLPLSIQLQNEEQIKMHFLWQHQLACVKVTLLSWLTQGLYTNINDDLFEKFWVKVDNTVTW